MTGEEAEVLAMATVVDHALPMTDGGWDAVADAVRTRRTALGLRQDDIAGVSPASMARIENAVADSYRGLTLRRLERALGWAPGSIDEIRQGGEPTLADSIDVEGGLYSSVEQLTSLVTLLEDRIRALEEKLDRRDAQAQPRPSRARR